MASLIIIPFMAEVATSSLEALILFLDLNNGIYSHKFMLIVDPHEPLVCIFTYNRVIGFLQVLVIHPL